MIGAIATVHGQHGFFLSNNGFEYNLALIGLLLPVFIAGPGGFAIGRLLPLPKRPQSDRPILILE
jgi:putative oxidoreductase